MREGGGGGEKEGVDKRKRRKEGDDGKERGGKKGRGKTRLNECIKMYIERRKIYKNVHMNVQSK